jgi:phage-related protein (TIGR01555 family)
MARSPATKKLPVRDGFVNLVNNLGSTKDPRMATSYSFVPMSSEQLITAYRSNWLAGRIVDAFAEDATREWRSWQASDEQIQAIEDEERKHNLQKKVRQALIRARLFGGAALVMGVDGTGNVSEPLDLDDVTEGALKFIIPLSNIEISRGQLIVDVTSPWFGRPEYYRINTGRADLSDVDNSAFTDIHPSRVVEFVGREIPDWNIINGTTTWGDSVLQIVDDVLKDYGMSLSAIAAMINDCKVDIFTIPGLTKHISNPDYERRLTTRLTVSNTMKSTINAMLMDENEKHERIQTTFSGLPQIMSELLKVVAGAAGIPMTRLVGHGSGSGKSTLGNGTSGGESDLRNYYDEVTSSQKNEYGPLLAPLDEIVERSALGTYDDKIYYEWTPLYTPDPMEEAQIALSKAQTFTADVTAGLINPDVLRKIRINQLTEDATYPGIEDAIEEFGEEPDEPSIGPEDVQAHLSMLQSSSQQLQQIGKAAQPAAALPAPKPEPTTDAHPLENLRMFGR